MRWAQASLFPDDTPRYDTRGFFESIAERLVRPYLVRIKDRNSAPGRKELNDPVWETLTLYPVEVVVLDSPLLQRLRLIRQLGVAHYVYPGTTHTRLEHSLGVLQQMQRLVDAINASLAPVPVDVKTTRLLRLIALCHDLGHGVMSHVAENALRHYDEIEQIELAFVDDTGGERAKLSEIAAYYIIGSPAFRDLLRTAQDTTHDYDLPPDAVELMQKAIVGQRISDDIPLLNELISGPFDADKLDYMTRDAQMAGVPIVTDIPRLVKKVRAVRVAREDLPSDIAKAVEERPAYFVTGIALSGGRTLDELMLGRTLLFDKIYRHQKVRAAEAMVGGIIRCIREATGLHPAEIPYVLTDDELVNLTVSNVASLAGRELTPEEVSWASTAAILAARMRARDLWVRAFAFAQAMPLDPHRHHPSQRQGLELLVRDAVKPTSREVLVRRIIEELRRVLTLLEKTTLLPRECTEAYITLDPPSTAPPGGDIPRAYLITPSGKLTRFREDAAETRGWADAYLLTRDIGYVFAPEELAPYVYLAAQTVVRDGYGVQIPDSMLSYAKQEPSKIAQFRSRLQAKRYYEKLPHDLRPLPRRLQKADVRKTIDDAIKNLAGYQGPILPEEAVAKSTLDHERILNWLRQFEHDSLISDALAMLRQIRLIGRSDAAHALSSFITSNPEYRGASLCVLGSLKDSSSITTYYAHDITEKYGLVATTLPYALTARQDHPIIFIDDFIGSGAQSISIIEQWLGEKPTTELGEERIESLSEEGRSALRGRTLGFVFSSGMSGGPDALRARCKELKLSAKIGVHIAASALPRAFDRGIAPALKERCREIGRQLIGDHPRVNERALGYGNESLLVVFPYNTPTQTLTCLWKDGTVDGVPWAPLFPRRKKK